MECPMLDQQPALLCHARTSGFGLFLVISRVDTYLKTTGRVETDDTGRVGCRQN